MALLRNAVNLLVWIVCVWLLSALNSANYLKSKAFPRTPEAPKSVEVTIVAVGDLISHQDVQKAALEAENGWASLWEEITPFFMSADLAMANLETPIAPKAGKPGIPFCFNGPSALVEALRETGVSIVFAANNHMYDQSVNGLAETIDTLLANSVLQAGCGMSKEEALAPKIIELKGGIKVAVLARTDLFNNNLNQRPDRPWVAALDLDVDENIIRDAHQRADAVIIGVHWGVEYQAQPSQRQRDAARRLVAAGADVIVGHHPHVLQAFEWVESGGRRGAVAFSLGNFLSNQDRKYNPSRQPLGDGDSRDGAALWVSLRKGPTGELEIDAHAEPIWTDNNCNDYEGGRSAKRVIRVMSTRPGARGQDMEELLAKRRAHALLRLNGPSGAANSLPPDQPAPAG